MAPGACVCMCASSSEYAAGRRCLSVQWGCFGGRTAGMACWAPFYEESGWRQGQAESGGEGQGAWRVRVCVQWPRCTALRQRPAAMRTKRQQSRWELARKSGRQQQVSSAHPPLQRARPQRADGAGAHADYVYIAAWVRADEVSGGSFAHKVLPTKQASSISCEAL